MGIPDLLMSSYSFLPSKVSAYTQSIAADDIVALGLTALLTASYLLRGLVWDKPDPYRKLWFEKPQDAGTALRNSETRDIARKLEEAVRSIKPSTTGREELIPWSRTRTS